MNNQFIFFSFVKRRPIISMRVLLRLRYRTSKLSLSSNTSFFKVANDRDIVIEAWGTSRHCFAQLSSYTFTFLKHFHFHRTLFTQVADDRDIVIEAPADIVQHNFPQTLPLSSNTFTFLKHFHFPQTLSISSNTFTFLKTFTFIKQFPLRLLMIET